MATGAAKRRRARRGAGQEPPLKSHGSQVESMPPRPIAGVKHSSFLAVLRRFRIRRHHVQHVSVATIGLIVLALVFVAGTIIRVAMGPVSLGPFSGKLRDAIVHSLPGLLVRYDDAALEWSRDEGRVNLIITGAQVFDRDQHLIAQAPKAEIGLAAMPLLHGEVQVRRINLVGVQLTLVRTSDGALHLGVERDKSRGDVLEQIREAIEKSGKGPTSLEHLAVSHARLAFYDEGTGLFAVSPEAKLEISSSQSTSGREVVADIDASVEITGRPAHVVGRIRLPRKGGAVSGDFSVTGLDLEALARNSKTFAALQPFDLKTDLSGSFVFDHGNNLRSADLGIAASGTIGGLGSPLVIKSLRFVGRYDGASGRLLIDDATLEGNAAKAHFQGTSTLAFAPDGSMIKVDLDLSGDEIALRMPDTFQQSVTLGHLGLRGTYTAAGQTFSIGRFWLSGSPVSGELSGRIVLAQNKSPEVDLNGKINELSVRDLVRYWPLRIGEGARKWISANVPAGRVGPISISTDIKAGELDGPSLPDSALALSFPIKDTSVNYIRGLTLVTHASGSGVLAGDTFKAAVASANIGPLRVTKGAVTIPNLHVHGTTGEITGSVLGQLRDVLALIDMKPLQYPTRFHIHPADTAGAANVDVDFHVPMLRNLNVSQVGIAVKASVSGLGLTLGKSTRVSNGVGTITVDNDQLRASGEVNLGRTRISTNWTETFAARNDITSKIQVRGTLDGEAREAMNFHTGDLFTGPVGIVAQLDGHRGAIRQAQIAVDLTPAVISIGAINYAKPAGVPASAQVTARFDQQENIASEDVSVSGAGGLAAQGALNFSPDGSTMHAEFPSVHAGPANDFALSLTQAAGNGFEIAVRGKSADASALGKKSAKPGEGKTGEDNARLHIVGKLDRVLLGGGVTLAGVNADYTAIGNRVKAMSLTAGQSKADQLAATITPVSDGRKVSIEANDAGTLLKGVLGLSNISGGHMSLTAKLPPIGSANGGTDYSGTLVIRDFKIENQPFFARLFSAGSFGGLLDLMRGQGIVIDKLEMPFSTKDDVINIREAHASGPSVGLSAEGYIDRKANKLELRGAVAPIYGINSVLGAIPLVGNILVSKEGEGIIGVTYTASGSLDEPKIAVNPLAMLTPGIFRRIFEGAAPSSPRANAGNGPAQQAPH